MKPVWTCIHRDGDKFYHYGKGDWINAQNGEKVAPDLTGVEQKPVALFIGDATHLWIVDDTVRLLRFSMVMGDYSCFQEGSWVSVGTTQTIKGDVIAIPKQRDDWTSFKGDNPPAQGSIVDVEWFDGDTDFGRPANGYGWSPRNQIKRWRYA